MVPALRELHYPRGIKATTFQVLLRRHLPRSSCISALALQQPREVGIPSPCNGRAAWTTEIEQLAQSHTANEWWGRLSDPDLSASEVGFLLTQLAVLLPWLADRPLQSVVGSELGLVQGVWGNTEQLPECWGESGNKQGVKQAESCGDYLYLGGWVAGTMPLRRKGLHKSQRWKRKFMPDTCEELK